MPVHRPFSKKTATRYALVHRPQDDPLVNDENVPSQVFTEISAPSSATEAEADNRLHHEVKHRSDLEEEFGRKGEATPVNEEVAAEHGVRFNDNYDYLQHLRELGQGDGDVAWIDATLAEKVGGKGKQKLEDVLRDVRLEEEYQESDSENGLYTNSWPLKRDQPGWQRYQEQQDVPDEIAGFQPNMDPRLREVLEALDDDAYLGDDHDLFDELAGEGGQEMDADEWEANPFTDADEDGWESDDTVKGVNLEVDSHFGTVSNLPGGLEELPESETNGAPCEPLVEHHQKEIFAEGIANSANIQSLDIGLAQRLIQTPGVARSTSLSETTSDATRRKKRKGALTSSTGFSMTSSALARSEFMSTLDARFDKVLNSYMEDIDEDAEDNDDDASVVTGVSKATSTSRMSSAGDSEAGSEAPSLVSKTAFNSAMDEFLTGQHGKKGRKMKKAGKQGTWGQQGGMQQLDEIRKGLGPARMSSGRKGVKV